MSKHNEIKKRLYNYSKIIAEKRELEIQLRELENSVGIKGIDYSSEGHTTTISRTTENDGIRIADAKLRLASFIDNKGIEIKRIENAISILNDKEMEIIELKYFKSRRADTIPMIIDRSRRTCFYLEESALKKINSIINLKLH